MKIAIRLALVLVATTCLAGRTSAQVLANEWFKVNATATGFAYDNVADKQEKVKVKVVNYVRFLVPAEGFGTYLLEVWNEVSPGVWAPVSGGEATAADPNEEVFYDGFVTLFAAGSAPGEGSGNIGFDMLFTAKSTIKTKDGALTKAKIKQIGAVTEGSSDGDNIFDGTAKFTMTRVPEDKLPFSPVK